jgi:hypothetical protein
MVQSGSKTVNQTLTNQSGEFELELEPAGSLSDWWWGARAGGAHGGAARRGLP